MILSIDKGSLDTPDDYSLGGYRSSKREAYYLRETFSRSSGRNSTPLHYACGIGSWEIVEELLNGGADWLKKNDDEKIPRDFLDEELDQDFLEKYDDICRKLEEAKREKERIEQEELERKEKERLEQEQKNRPPENAENTDENEVKDTESESSTDAASLGHHPSYINF